MSDKTSKTGVIRDNRPRLYYLDWIRVLAMGGIFFFHNARFFDEFSDWHVKNASTSIGASALIGFMDGWIMPLFFLVAGAATYYALKSRRVGQFIQERTLRLLIPLIFGMFVIVVPQAYFEAVSHGELLEGYNFFQIYRLYLQTLPELNWFHLWFLVYLFIFSIITLPIFRTRNSTGKSVVSKLAMVLNKPWTLILLLVFSIAIVNIYLYPAGFFGHRGTGGSNIVAYLLFYISGYLIYANPRIMEIVKRLRWITLTLGVIATICIFVFFLDEAANPTVHFGTTKFAIAQIVQALNSWSWLLAILGLGTRFLNRNNRFLSYANEAVLPFYVLHQTIIIAIGFYVVQWSMGVPAKYAIISSTSFAAIMAFYEVLIRRVNVFRVLFGMRPKKRQS
ncbi:acyltransferase family protein [Chloroflexota bacterium]